MKQIRAQLWVQLRFKRVAIAMPRAIIVLNICARREVDRVIIISSTISNSSVIVLIDIIYIYIIISRVFWKSLDKISVGEFLKFFF